MPIDGLVAVVGARRVVLADRPEQRADGGPPKRWAHTACRVVMTLPGVIDMLNQMAGLQRRLTEEQDRGAGSAGGRTAAASLPGSRTMRLCWDAHNDSNSAGIAEQLMATNGPSLRGELP